MKRETLAHIVVTGPIILLQVAVCVLTIDGLLDWFWYAWSFAYLLVMLAGVLCGGLYVFAVGGKWLAARLGL